VARIIPWHGEQDDELLTLANEGLICLGNGQIDDHFWQLPAPRVSETALRDAMTFEREDA
jgi:hypothetical protein